VQFGYGPQGKPILAGQPGGIRFNLSHSHDLALYAVTRGQEVGVDVERLRPDLAIGQIAARWFSAGELTAWRALGPPSARGIFNAWTRKEAYVKAGGEGLTHPSDESEVSLASGVPAALVSSERDGGEASRWSLRALDPGPGYVAALPVEGHGWRLRLWQWSE
jgi:4'-phosphopantetheinyl transferase